MRIVNILARKSATIPGADRLPTEAALLCGLRDHPSVTQLMRNGFVTAVLNGTL
jgi:hypothetical protein